MYVYILRCSNGRYYIGSTSDIARRLREHAIGKNKSTKHLLPVELVFYQKYPSLFIARKTEYWLKKQKDRTLMSKLFRKNIFIKSSNNNAIEAEGPPVLHRSEITIKNTLTRKVGVFFKPALISAKAYHLSTVS